MWRITLPLASLFLPLATPLATQAQTQAQTSAAITQVGYQTARPVLVAPGQVVHLRLHGVTTAFNLPQVTQGLPLSVFYNGMFITLQRSGSAATESLPLLRLDGVSTCSSAVDPNLFGASTGIPCGADSSYDLWLQIPFDLVPNAPGSDQCPPLSCNLNDAVLTINEVSGQGLSVRVLPVSDQVHILSSCTDNIGTVGIEGTSVYASYACLPAITHGDNSWVTAANPAKPGEELIAYAFGLGSPATSFDITGGTPAGGVAMAKPFTISFPGIASAAGVHPDYVGLVGGNPGLYQINFHVPSVPAALALCTTSGNSQLATNPFNITMSLMGTASLDQASFCVKP
jgi:uncharacterized protein (TIGR03437 family)